MVQATPEIRRALLDALGAPPGSVTITRRPSGDGDTLIVAMAPGLHLPPERMPRSFGGVPVHYEHRRPAKAFA